MIMAQRNEKTHALLEDLPRGVWSRPAAEQIMPYAAWADPEDILASERLKYDSSKILLGAIDGQLIGTDDGDDRHVVLIAGSRAGKGVSSIIPNLFLYRGSVLVIDPKGELARITAQHRAKVLGQKCYVLDPFKRSAVEEYFSSYNPFTLLEDEAHIIENAALLADSLIVHNDRSDPYWNNSARDVLEAVILHVATFPRYAAGKRNLLSVRHVVLGGVRVETQDGIVSGLDGLLLEMRSNTALDGFIAAMARSIQDKPEKERGSVMSTLRLHTKFLDFPAMRGVLEKSDFSLSDLKTDEGGVTIYLCLPVGRIGTCAGWLRLFINLALEAMEQTTVGTDIGKTGTGNPVLFLLDEFFSLGHMRQLELAASQIAGFGAKLFCVLQDVNQIKTLYKSNWQTFLGNAGVIQCFGNSDPATLDYISKRLGETTVTVENKSQLTHSQKMGGATGESFSVQLQSLMSGEEVSRVFARDDQYRRQLILWAGHSPLNIQRTVYHDKSLKEHTYFEGRYDGQ